MKIEFRLTVDQYIEWRDLDHEKVESMAPLFIVGAGILLLLAGNAITQSATGPNESTGPVILAMGRALPLSGILVMAMGLILPFAAILLVFYQRHSRQKNNKREDQRTFERSYAGLRTFEADGSTWQFSYEGSRDTRDWPSLCRMVKTDDLFIMQDAYQYYPLSRAALTLEQHGALEDLCKRALLPKERSFSVSMVPSAYDYVTAMMRRDWWERPWKSLAWACFGLICLWLFAAHAIADSWPAIGRFAFIPFILVLPVLQGLNHYQRFEDYRERSFHTAEITEDRICFIFGTLYEAWELRVLHYRRVHKIRESRRMIFLYHRPDYAYVIPKAAFEPQQLTRFRQLLKELV